VILDRFVFGVLPYLAIAVAVGGGIYRWRFLPASLTARSSQLLEGRLLFLGSVAWHPAVLLVLAGHLAATIAPGPWARLLGDPVRLWIVEGTGLALGALALLGALVLLVRRFRLRTPSRPVDLVALVLLVVQAATGVWIAYTLRWGASWYVSIVSPWLASLAQLDPRVDAMAVLPLVVKVHAVNAFLLVALVPFGRLMHVVIWPVSYLWRAPQLVLWRRARAHEEVSR
jgi:nitrate reductase gamma subunit